MEPKTTINNGEAVLGIEFGSTRIKAVLADAKGVTLAVGTHDWENRLENGLWTYSMEDIIGGLQGCYASLKKQVKEKYGITLHRLAGAGISAMMHGYLAFDKEGALLTPFRTWRNACTGPGCGEALRGAGLPYAPALDCRPPVSGGAER